LFELTTSRGALEEHAKIQEDDNNDATVTACLKSFTWFMIRFSSLALSSNGRDTPERRVGRI